MIEVIDKVEIFFMVFVSFIFLFVFLEVINIMNWSIFFGYK